MEGKIIAASADNQSVQVPEDARATSLVSMKKKDKEYFSAVAKAHGLSLSAFFRLAAEEYIKNHEW